MYKRQLVASAAIVEDDVLIAEYTTDYKKTHSQTLLPMLDEIRQMIDLDLHTIDAVSYTHLDVYKRQPQHRIIIRRKRDNTAKCYSSFFL